MHTETGWSSPADITHVSERIRTGQLSPVDVVSACLAQIERLNPTLNAFITVLAESALAQARNAESEIRAGMWRGPLHGIPVGIKDFYDTAGVRTTAAFEHFRSRVPVNDAVGVAKLKNAGAIIIGKTNMHELGTGTTGLESCFGPVRNPWNVAFIPGGSSSGSAVAVASSMCYATLDTDAIGSTRLPAACCGVVGFKGTYGLISSAGILAGEEDPGERIRWFSHPGVTTRTVSDTAVMLDVLADQREHALSGYRTGLGATTPLRIGVADHINVDRDVMAVFEQAVATVRGFADDVRCVTPPFEHPFDDFDCIEADRATIAERTFREIDVLLLPTTVTAVPSVEAAEHDPQALSSGNTAFANYYGLPAISVPCGFDANELPLGLQIVSKPWGELTVLRLALCYQEATPWTDRHPNL